MNKFDFNATIQVGSTRERSSLGDNRIYSTPKLIKAWVDYESIRLHFVAPILICVVFLFGPNVHPVEIVIEEDLTGEIVIAPNQKDYKL